jgi:predicted helicase
MSKQKPGQKSPLQALLDNFRSAAVTEREKGTYFEELILLYLKNEPRYKDLYDHVWMYADWAKEFGSEFGFDGRDTGIDLVAREQGTGEFHAIQCKFFAPQARVQKSDIDSFFTASGQRPFSQRIIVVSTNNWSEHAEAALANQTLPVMTISLWDLEESLIDWSQYKPKQAAVLRKKKQPREHQTIALEKVKAGFKTSERGKLIMACGTGKTFTSLKIAEEIAGEGGRVLFMVPSLALLSQALTEWTQEASVGLHSFAVCSDAEIGKKRNHDDERVETFAHELSYPATTNAKSLAQAITRKHDKKHMTVVFSTYHSIDVISQAQKKQALAEFDLIICDEAHRTTGATFNEEDESAFVRVHDNKHIKGAKRLYMTATPRIFGNAAKATAEEQTIQLCSMDDEALYGKEFYTISFSEAVGRDLLVDYKVIVLAVDEAHVNRRLQKLLADETNELRVDDAARIIGCWKALSKFKLDPLDDPEPMRRAVAFCQRIEPVRGKRAVASKLIAKMFQAVVEEYQKNEPEAQGVICSVAHVDGSMQAFEKEDKLRWLKEPADADTCRILSNVRCLSEGVDVPALDAVLFLSPRQSQVDVVQSVGRVMRRADGKKRGYVILPVVIPAGVEPHEALNDNQTYRVVWQVLQALRAHDDRFDAMVNKMDLVGPDISKIEIITVSERLPQRRQNQSAEQKLRGQARGGQTMGRAENPAAVADTQQLMEFAIGDMERAIYARIVKKVGNPRHWEEWAFDVGKIANTHIDRIKAIIENKKNETEIKAFNAFAAELRDDLNDSISDQEVIEMLAQHLVTKPVFDALFSNYSFAKQNPVSQALDKVLKTLEKHHLGKEADTLQKFYDSVKLRAQGIDSAAGKQKIILELYDKFFRGAFPKLTERLGIVYTPVEVVDFILHSVNELLQSEFGQSLGSENVHIIDPFVGTGTFITRLIQSGLIAPKDLPHKYKNEIHANEIVLLAYYIAAINIEAAYHDAVSAGETYEPFAGICLTDTFQLYEKDDQIAKLLANNSDRRNRQKNLDIRVMIGNPPYSAGQDSANDNNQNVKYPTLDGKIAATYAKHSKATNKNALYDSYIRAIRWGSDRIGDAGILGFVTNAGWVEANTADGMRKCLAEEFSSIYVFHLRGNQRTSGETSRKEGGKIFGSGSRAPIAVSFLIKNPKAKSHGQIFLHDIGDYLSREEKLTIVRDFKSVNGITQAKGWQQIKPDQHHDWINQRDDSFAEFISIGEKRDKQSLAIFDLFSAGVKTSRDAWAYNFSQKNLEANMARMIDFYNKEVRTYKKEAGAAGKNAVNAEKLISRDSTKISWNRSLLADLQKLKEYVFSKKRIVHSLYRPFTKSWLYFDRRLNDMIYQLPRIFPDAEAENLMIVCKQRWSGEGHFALLTDRIMELQTDGGTQCFPLYLYDDKETKGGLFEEDKSKSGKLIRRDAISDAGLKHFAATYPGEKIKKEDLFYYIYGLLHSPEYRQKYVDNLSKELPRIPRVKSAEDFWAFCKAGRALGELHVNYEKQKKYGLNHATKTTLKDTHYRVEKMRYNTDKTAIIYNTHLTLEGIPPETHEYVINGKSALDWVVERYCVKTDKDSGIINDANAWALETEKNPRYIVELIERIVTVSLETIKIVNGLPALSIVEGSEA